LARARRLQPRLSLRHLRREHRVDAAAGVAGQPRGQTIRLRLLTASDRYGRIEDIWVDAVGIGEQPPLSPTLLSPIAGGWVSEVRPTLRLQNAIDLQSDPLTYRFEVYGDAALTNLVAQVPAVASGAGTTSWQVDVNLPNNTQYWWRACAATARTSVPGRRR